MPMNLRLNSSDMVFILLRSSGEMFKMNCISKYTFTLIPELAYYEERADMGASQGLSARQIHNTW